MSNATSEPESNATNRVFVIDDDPGMRDAIVGLLESAGHEVASFANAHEFLTIADNELHGCMIVDVRMPGMTGLELQKSLQQRSVKLPMIFVTGHGNVAMAVRAMREEAFDFLEKPFEDEVLLGRVQEAIEEEARSRGQRAWENMCARLWEGLTDREREVTGFIANGLANKQIAKQLGISVRTVENHRSQVMRKLNVDSVAELTRIYMTLHGSAVALKPSELN